MSVCILSKGTYTGAYTCSGTKRQLPKIFNLDVSRKLTNIRQVSTIHLVYVFAQGTLAPAGPSNWTNDVHYIIPSGLQPRKGSYEELISIKRLQLGATEAVDVVMGAQAVV